MDIKTEIPELLRRLVMTPGPSGFEQPVQKVIREALTGTADSIEPDFHGNLIACVNKDGSPKVMIAVHCDQIGFMVSFITSDGFLIVQGVGGIDVAVLPGAQVLVHTTHGPVPGVFGRKPIHLQSTSEKSQVPPIDEMWINIGACSEEDTSSAVQIGDYVTFVPSLVALRNGLISGPALDNRVGVYVGCEILKRLDRSRLSAAVYLVSTAQEEIGSRGAQTTSEAIRPDVAFSIDVTLGNDDPGSQKPHSVPCRLGLGPCISHGPNTNPAIEKLLQEAASAKGIRFQTAPSGSLEGNDAKSLQVASNCVATAAISIAQRYMHTQVEVVSLTCLEHTIRLIEEFLYMLNDDVELRPFYSQGQMEPVPTSNELVPL